MCCKMIVNAGIVEVVYEEEYKFSAQARKLLKSAGVKLRRFRRGGGR
jgi:deoxycytidylate deaminase